MKHNKEKGFEIRVSTSVVKSLKEKGFDETIIRMLEDFVNQYPKGKYEVDTTDALSVGDVPLSWIRDWNNRIAFILTREEAIALDKVAC